MMEYPIPWPGLTVDRRALVALEYALIAGLLAIVVLTASTTLGSGIVAAFVEVADRL
jgi:pilus assembly protein Flp/PilA